MALTWPTLRRLRISSMLQRQLAGRSSKRRKARATNSTTIRNRICLSWEACYRGTRFNITDTGGPKKAIRLLRRGIKAYQSAHQK
jgi:hypothetical protein